MEQRSISIAASENLEQVRVLKNVLKRILSSAGYDIKRRKTKRVSADDFGLNAFRDMQRLSKASPGLTIIDAGANEGQTINEFRNEFDHPIIHAFEPGPVFIKLRKQTLGIPDLHLNNFALGSKAGEMDLTENEYSSMNSLLEPGADSWGVTRKTQKVAVQTLDDYCARKRLTHIDILKSDTQGFDLEVVKGASQLLTQNRVHLIYMEIIFSDMYKGLPSLDEIYRFMTDHGFRLVSFYQFFFQHDCAAWTDALFVNPKFDKSA
jgi:FkbM family methyltransferase